MDPEPDMLRQAERAARERGALNVMWVTGRAQDLRTLEPSIGHFNLVTIGTAFHFMEPLTTLRDLQRIAPGGAIVVVYNGSPMWLHPQPWAVALRSVLEARLGRLSGGDFTASALRDAEKAMRELGYASIELWERSNAVTIDVDFVVGHILSAMSPEQLPAAQRDEFAGEVANAISAAAPSGRLVENVRVRAVIGQAPRIEAWPRT